MCCKLDQDIIGKNLDQAPFKVATVKVCQKLCQGKPKCLSFAFNQNENSKKDGYDGCWLKSKELEDIQANNEVENKTNVTIGPKFCPGTYVVLSFARFILVIYLKYLE